MTSTMHSFGLQNAPLLALLALFACRNKDLPETGQDSVPQVVPDADGDGFDVESDCDDDNAAINPDAEELCDGVDNDCDGTVDVDASDAQTWYDDSDGDGFGLDDAATVACDPPAGAVAEGGDCDDSDAAYYPGAPEDDCTDPNDYNCDGSVGYADGDGDGFAACEECDDGDAAINPDASEVCDSVDNDCDALIDDADDSLDTSTGQPWYGDGDGDGYGDPAAMSMACDQPSGAVSDATDCDDGDAAVNPGASEVCNDVDDDCDGLIDDADDSLDSSTGSTWYADTDGDSYGDPDTSSTACDQPSGAVSDATDCDDTDATVNPAASEICDSVDNDCDGLIDDADDSLDTSTSSTWYADADGDSYGDAATSGLACDQPSGAVSDATDCDDTDAAVNPAATEICNDLDDDCDGDIDDADDSLDSSTASTWYADTDGDSYGDASTSGLACDQPSGAVSDATDCDDSDAAINPGATEICNDLDDDCDGDIDDDDTSLDSSTASTWYSDSDGDSYGDASSSGLACDQPSGAVSDATDCDDGDSGVNPGASESCDGVDEDCDSDVDEGVLGTGTSCPAESCLAILNDGTTTDGTYSLEGTSGAVFDAYCDQTSDGGGWTLAGSVVNDAFTSGSHIRSWDSLAVWTDATTFGAISTRQASDYKGEAYTDIPGDDVLVSTDEYAFGFYNIVGSQSFADHILAEYDSSACNETFTASGADYYDVLSADQALAHSWIIRGKDTNASCFPGSNENSLIGNQLPSCCWVAGMGNCPTCYPTWDDYDTSLFQLDQIVAETCTAGTYPCNDAGYRPSKSYFNYNYADKVTYAEIYVR